MAGIYAIRLLRGGGLRVAPGLTLPSNTIRVQANNDAGQPIPGAEFEAHIAFGGGIFPDPVTGVERSSIRGTADAQGRLWLPEFRLGPVEGPNRLLIQTLHASYELDIVATLQNTRLVIQSPPQGDEKLASRSFDVVVRLVDVGFLGLGVPDIPIEIEVSEGEATFASNNGAPTPVGVRRTGPDGYIRFELETGWREEPISVKFTAYWHRAIPAETLRLRAKAPRLMTYRTSGGVPVSPVGSMPVPFRSAVSRDGFLPLAINPGQDVQSRFAISRTTGPVRLWPEFAGQYIPEWSWFPEPTGPGTVAAFLRLPDHPETAELREEWSIQQSPLDGPPISVSGPGSAGIYVQTTGGGDRDMDSMLALRLIGQIFQFVGPNATSPTGVQIRPSFLQPPAGHATRRLIEARVRCKLRVSPFNSAVDSAAHASVVPGAIGLSASGPWSDELIVTLTPGVSIQMPRLWFKAPPQNFDHHVEITADVTLEELDATGTIVRFDQKTTLALRTVYLKPRLNFVRMQGANAVPIAEESLRMTVVQDAAGNALSLDPTDEFRLELIGQDLGASVTADILAGEIVRDVKLERIEVKPSHARYRSGPCYLYMHEQASGETRPLAPPDVTFVWAGHASRISAEITRGMPGNTANPPVEYRTGIRPLTQFSLIELGDAVEDQVIPKPIIILRLPDSAICPARVVTGRILVTIAGEVHDALADLGNAPPNKIFINGQSFPILAGTEIATTARPQAWIGTFTAEVEMPLGAHHVTLSVINSAGQETKSSLRLLVTELDNRRTQPQRVQADAAPFVPPLPPPVPALRFVYAACMPSGIAGVLPVLPVSVSGREPWPSATVSSQVNLRADRRAALSPLYLTKPFLCVGENQPVASGFALPPSIVVRPDRGRLEWSGDLPNPAGAMKLAARIAPITRSLRFERKTSAGQWEPAKAVKQGDRIRLLGTVESDDQRIEATVSFVDPNGRPVEGKLRNVAVVLIKPVGGSEHELAFWLDPQYQEQAGAEILICADGEEPSPAEATLQICHSGSVQVDRLALAAAVLPTRHQRASGPVDQEPLGSGASRLGPGPCVVPATGEVVHAIADLLIQSRGINLELSRSWRSGNNYPGSLGWGWSTSWEEFAWEEGEGQSARVTIFTSGGHILAFQRNTSGQWEGPAGLYAKLDDWRSGYRLLLPHGIEKRYLPTGLEPHALLPLATTEDRFGNLERWHHPSHGRPAKVAEPLGRTVQFRFKTETGTIDALGDWTGRCMEYDVAATSDIDGGARTLREVRTPLIEHAPGTTPKRRRTAYRWKSANGRHELRDFNDPVGVAGGLAPIFAFTWRSEGDVETVGYDGNIWTFTLAADRMEWTDPLGGLRRAILWLQSPAGFARPIGSHEETLAGRAITTVFRYNTSGERIRQTAPRLGVTEWIYDEAAADVRSRGNILSTIRYPTPNLPSTIIRSQARYDPNASFAPVAVAKLMTSNSYDGVWQLPETFTDAAAQVTTFAIADGTVNAESYPQVTTSAGPQAKVVKREWNRWGQLLREFAPNGVITRFAYYPIDDPTGQNPASLPVSNADKAGGFLATITHDAQEPGGVRAAHLAPVRPVVERIRYDSLGRITREQLGNGTRMRKFNAAGEILLLTEPDGTEISSRRNDNGWVEEQATKREDRNFPADLASVPTRTIRHRFDYNRAGQKIEEIIDPDDVNIKSAWTYDALGRLELHRRARVFETNDPRPNSTVTHEYDELNRLVKVITAKGSNDEFTQCMEYDDDSNLIDQWCPDSGGGRRAGQIFFYDGFGRRSYVADRDGNRSWCGYDENTHITRRWTTGSVNGEPVADPATAPILSDKRLFLDEAGFLTAELDRVFSLEQTATGWREVAIGTGSRARIYSRDVVGYDLACFSDPPSVMATTTFDGHGLKVAESSGLNEQASYRYDDTGRLIEAKVTNARGSYVFETRRDLAGRPTAQLIDGVLVQEWRYDSAGHVRLQLDAYGNPTEQIYDGAGRRIATMWRLYEGGQRVLDASGMIGQISATETLKEFYDAESNLISSISSAGNLIERRVFDDRGFVVERTLPEDAFDLNAPEPGGGIRHIVRDDHQGVSKWTYTWTVDGRPKRTTDPDGRWLDHDYTVAGRLERRSTGEPAGVARLPGSRQQSFKWDGLDRITSASDDNGFANAGIVLRQSFTSLGGLVDVFHNEDLRPSVPRLGSSRLTSSYRRDGARLTITWPWGLTVEYRPDALGRVQSVYDQTNSEEIASYVWDGNLVERRLHANGTNGFATTYDPQGRVKTQKTAKSSAFNDPAQLLEARIFEYEPSGLPLQIADLRAELLNPTAPVPVTAMGYDSRNRQTAQIQGDRTAAVPTPIIVPRAGTFQAYDADGNLRRTEEFNDVVGRARSRTRYQPRPGAARERDAQIFVNGANQIGAHYRERQGAGDLEDGYRYDRRGNLIRDEFSTYSYDIHGRLSEIRSLVDSSSARLYWDALDRPVRVVVDNGTTVADRRLLWLGEDLAGEDNDAAEFHFYIRGPQHELIAFERRDAQARERYHCHTGADGSLQFSTRPDGTDIVETYGYTPLGVPKVTLGSGVSTATGNRLSWHGHYYLREFGVSLAGPRIYHPLLGRFLQPDPAGPFANTMIPGNSYGYGAANGQAYGDDGNIPILVVAGYIGVAMLVASITADVVAPVVGGWGGKLGAAQTIANFGVLHNLAAAFTGEEFYTQAELSGGERIFRGVGAIATLLGGAAAGLRYLKAGSTVARAVAGVATAADMADNAVNVVGGVLCGNPVQVVCGALGVGAGRLCFLPGTMVVTSSGLRPIETIAVGDLVLSQCEATGAQDYQRVVTLFEGQTDFVCELRICEVESASETWNAIAAQLHIAAMAEHERMPGIGASRSIAVPAGEIRSSLIRCTPEHPFYSPYFGWRKACDLSAGDHVLAADGSVQMVTSSDIGFARSPTFNLEIANWHTYFVAGSEQAEAVWVHNLCPMDAQYIVDEIHLARAWGHGGPNVVDNALITLRHNPTSLTWFTHNGQDTVIISSIGNVSKHMRERAADFFGKETRVIFASRNPKGAHAELRGEVLAMGFDLPQGVPIRQVGSHFACSTCSRRLFAIGSEGGRTRAQSLFGVSNLTGAAVEHGDIIARSHWRSRNALLERIYNPQPKPAWDRGKV